MEKNQVDIKVCRMCLKMQQNNIFRLDQHPLETYYFELLLGSSPITAKVGNNMACQECLTSIKEYYQFRLKCIQSQSILDNMAVDGVITSKILLRLRRSKAIANNISQSSTIHQDNKETPNIQPTSDPVSPESVSHKEPVQFVTTEATTEPTVLAIKIEAPDSPKEDNYDVEDVVVKEEDDIDSYEPPMDPVTSSDDDQPLAKQKRKKEKEKIKKIKVRGSAKKQGRKKSETSGDDTKSKALACGVDLPIEDYMTVINLTVEEQLEEINKRKETSNYLNSPFQCNQCYKGFIDAHAWKHHVGKHSPSAGDIECPICKFRFKTKRALQKHAINHEKKYACKACPYVSTNTTQAKQHQGWHKGVTYKCNHCEDVFSVWTSYMSHVRIKHPSEFICGICGYSFISKLGLTMHKTMMHKDHNNSEDMKKEEGPYCKECDVKFVSEEAYKRHTVMSAKHTPPDTKAIKGCRTCGEQFESSEELRLHHRREHARSRPKNYGKKPSTTNWPAKCEHCTEEVGSAREYWAHFRRAHPDKKYPIQKDYVCDICGKSFRGNAFLIYHRRTHFDEKPFKCTQCDKAFFNRSNLVHHERCHSDSRPYPCSVCFKAFKSKAAVVRHFRSHTGQKPYECEVCGKAFSQSNSRKLHVRTVHLKQPAPYISRSRLERRKQIAPYKEIAQQPFSF